MVTNPTITKINKGVSLNRVSIEAPNSLQRVTGLDHSSLIDGCIQAVWQTFLANGYRKFPSAPTVLQAIGSAGDSFYVLGKRVTHNEEN